MENSFQAGEEQRLVNYILQKSSKRNRPARQVSKASRNYSLAKVGIKTGPKQKAIKKQSGIKKSVCSSSPKKYFKDNEKVTDNCFVYVLCYI